MAHTTTLAYWTTDSNLGELDSGETFSFALTVNGADRVKFISGTYPGTLTISGVTVTLHGTAQYFINDRDYEFTLRAYDGTQTGNSNRLKFRYEGAEKILSFTGTIPATTSASTTYLFLGGNNRSGGAGGALATTYMDGYIAEVLIWTRTLTATEIASVESYINAKWALGL